eukprot:scaffold671_cov394-Pavlova_lutheri.AAC.1
MTDPAGAAAVPELNGRNWRQWFIRMENYLRIYGLWEVTCTEPELNSAEKQEGEEKHKIILQCIQQARCRIINSVNEEYSGHVNHCTTAHEAWKVLKDLYQNSSSMRESELREKLAKTRKRSDQSIDQYMNGIVSIVDELRQVNVDLPEEEVAHTVLDGLPDSYHMIVLILKHHHEKLTMSRIRLSLCYEENYQRKAKAFITQEAEEHPQPVAMQQPRSTRCQFCNKPGHTLNQCNRFKAAYPPKGISNTDRNDKPMSLMATSAYLETNNHDQWIIDSGASWHMTGHKEYLEVSTLKDFHTTIEIADGTHMKGEAIGRVVLHLGNNQDKTITLNNVVYVPGLASNLLSVTCMTENGATVSFNNGECKIKQGKQTLQAKLTGRANYCLTATAKIWHQRLGHIHNERIKLMGLPHQMTETCEPCMENKQIATKFKAKDYQYQPLDLIYMDVVGPIHPETPAGQRYFLSVLDHATKTSLIYLMSSKGSTGKYARMAINVLEQKSAGGRTVKAIRTDLGQEFLGNKLADFLSERGITHEKTAGYTPQQNDAERLHRDLREHASAMLNATNLPNKYWGEAVRAYCHIRNRVPPAHGEDRRPPLEKLSGSKQSFKHLRVFGCEAWVLKPEPKINGKFDTRSEKGIFIGYENSSTYRVLLDKRLVTSHNVRFNEFKMGQYNRQSDDTTTFYQDELISEPDQWEHSSSESETEEEEEEASKPEEDAPHATTETTEEKANSQPYNLRPNRQTKFTAYIAEPLPDKFDGYHKAMNRSDKKLWEEAIQNELEALSKMRTWDITDLPLDKKPIGTKWIFRVKRDQHGNITKYKARLVALGCHQKPGVDYDEIYASVVSKTGLRIFLAAVNHLDLHLHQMDIETAFLNADLQEEVYLRVPSGLNTERQNQALKLNRSLYGLKQAPRAWNEELTTTLKKLKFECIEVDQSILKCRAEEGTCYLCFYVDDILIASQQLNLIQSIKQLIQEKYRATDLGEAKHFLGIAIKRNRAERKLEMEQTNKVLEYLEQHGSLNSKGKEIPLSVPLETKTDEEISGQTIYQKIVGQLQYLGATTRPDLSQATSVLARFNSCPTTTHWKAIRGTLKYLNGTQQLTMQYCGTKEDTNQEVQITAYSDADYASNKENRRSRTGYAIMTMGALVSWQSKLQTTIATSTTEAEYQAASATIKETLWIRNLVKQLLEPTAVKVTIFIDNQSALRLLKNPQSVTQAKHIDVQHHFIRERAMREEIELTYCPTENMWADYLTKQVPAPKFKQCLENLGMILPPTMLSGSVG